MQLDYQAGKQTYILRVPRWEDVPIHQLVKEQGLDFSTSASTPEEAVLFTREPYAASTFAEFATPAARQQLQPIITEVERSWRSETNARIKCPADQELWPFQRAGVEYALTRNNTLIGDQPGLGKTPQAICFANEINAKRVLVICPANIRLQWAKFIRQWSTMRWPYIVYPILGSRSGVHPDAGWTIVSYDLARSEAIGRALAKGKYDVVILDEGHYLKTPDARRTRAVFGDHTGAYRREIRDAAGDICDYEILFESLASRCGAILALTGTPLPNRPRECYTLARGLCFESVDWMSEDSFRERFNPSARIVGERSDGTEYIYTREEAGRHGELQNRLRSHFMVRRLKRDVMPQLKLPVFSILEVEENSSVRKVLEAERMLNIDPDHLDDVDFQINGQISVVRHMMGVAMAPLVADHVDMLIDGGEEKLVVFGWHHDVLDIWEARFRDYGCLRIDGRTSATRKQKTVEEFVNNPKIKIIIGNMQAVGTGTDGLQKVAAHCLFGESSWTPGENEQCVDRLDRGGQARVVQADFMVAPGSLSEKILSTALRKLQTTDKALDHRFSGG